MQMSSDKAREVGEALIDAANNADSLGIPCDVIFNEDLNAAVCVPSDGDTEGIVHKVIPV